MTRIPPHILRICFLFALCLPARPFHACAAEHEGTLSTIFSVAQTDVSLNLDVSYKIGRYMGEPTRHFILRWKRITGPVEASPATAHFRARVYTSGGMARDAYVNFSTGIAKEGEWSDDFPGSPVWSQFFQDINGSNVDEDIAKSIFKEGFQLRDLEARLHVINTLEESSDSRSSPGPTSDDITNYLETIFHGPIHQRLRIEDWFPPEFSDKSKKTIWSDATALWANPYVGSVRFDPDFLSKGIWVSEMIWQHDGYVYAAYKIEYHSTIYDILDSNGDKPLKIQIHMTFEVFKGIDGYSSLKEKSLQTEMEVGKKVIIAMRVRQPWENPLSFESRGRFGPRLKIRADFNESKKITSTPTETPEATITPAPTVMPEATVFSETPEPTLTPDTNRTSATPTPSPTPVRYVRSSSDGRFKVTGEGVILDTRTNLEWIVSTVRGMHYDKAVQWVTSYQTDGGRWRMPTRFELEGIREEGRGPSCMFADQKRYNNMDEVFISSAPKGSGGFHVLMVWAEPYDRRGAWVLRFDSHGTPTMMQPPFHTWREGPTGMSGLIYTFGVRERH